MGAFLCRASFGTWMVWWVIGWWACCGYWFTEPLRLKDLQKLKMACRNFAFEHPASRQNRLGALAVHFSGHFDPRHAIWLPRPHPQNEVIVVSSMKFAVCKKKDLRTDIPWWLCAPRSVSSTGYTALRKWCLTICHRQFKSGSSCASQRGSTRSNASFTSHPCKNCCGYPCICSQNVSLYQYSIATAIVDSHRFLNMRNVLW